MPEIEVMQVEFVVKYVVELFGVIVDKLGGLISDVGADIVNASYDSSSMTELTTGIFGTDGGLLYWMNGYVVDLLAKLFGG